MPKIDIRCSACGHEARVPEEYRGKKVRCLRCRAKLRVPDIPASDEPREKRPAPTTARRTKSSIPGSGGDVRSSRAKPPADNPLRASRGAAGAPSSRARREVQEAIQEILADYEHALEPTPRGFDIDVRGIAWGLAKTLAEDMLSTRGVRDVKLAGGTGECRVVVTLEGAVFDPEDSFADQSDDTAYFRRPASKARSPVDDEPADRTPSPGGRGGRNPTTQSDGPRPDEALEKARELRDQGEVRAAMELLEDAVRATPDEPRLLEALGHAYASSGDSERARRAFRQLSRISGDDAQAHLLHAAAAFQCDRLEDARTALADAIRLDARNPNAYKYAAKIYEKLGESATAAKFRAKYEELKRGG